MMKMNKKKYWSLITYTDGTAMVTHHMEAESRVEMFERMLEVVKAGKKEAQGIQVMEVYEDDRN